MAFEPFGLAKMSFQRRRKGLSLIEVLVVIVMIGMLAGSALMIGIGVTGRFSPTPTSQSLKLEAEYARLWVEHIFWRALLERRFFTLVSVADYPAAKLKIRWDDDLSEEEFKSDKIAFIAEGTKYTFNYTPMWHTLTPAATLRVFPSGAAGGSLITKITISPYCRVSMTP